MNISDDLLYAKHVPGSGRQLWTRQSQYQSSSNIKSSEGKIINR